MKKFAMIEHPLDVWQSNERDTELQIEQSLSAESLIEQFNATYAVSDLQQSRVKQFTEQAVAGHMLRLAEGFIVVVCTHSGSAI